MIETHGKTEAPETVLDVSRTGCAVVGGGPAGALLSFMLARQGVEVTLLESQGDFDRKFRGDSLHPQALELVDQLGLSEKLHALPHTKAPGIPTETEEGPLTPVDLRYLRSSYRYVMLVSQARFLELLTDEAARHPNFWLVTGASVRRLVREGDRVAGVRYRSKEGWHEVRAGLVVAADGRNSKVRRLAGVEAKVHPSAFDALWFTMPRREGDPKTTFGRAMNRQFVGMLYRDDHWQVGVDIPKGSYVRLKGAGRTALRRELAAVLPEFEEHLEEGLKDWKNASFLDIRYDRLPRWYLPGLLFIGDAAHVMTPAFGVGINYAIQDAAVAANVLTRPLLAFQGSGAPVPERKLAAVQRRRGWPVRLIQGAQKVSERQITDVLAGKPPLSPLARRLLGAPGFRSLLARLWGIGLWRVRVRYRRPGVAARSVTKLEERSHAHVL